MPQKRSKTKIICTLGPASSNRPILRKMIQAGMDLARLNFSHGCHRDHIKRIQLVRELNRKMKRNIKILADLEGFRVRIGKLKEPILLKKKETVWLTQKEITGQGNHIPFDYRDDLKTIKKNQLIFIDDGNICLKVIGHKKDTLRTEVIIGGLLKEHKGINIPGAKLRFSSLTDKDKINLEFCLEHKVDYIAQSFVRNKKDILAIKKVIKNNRSNIKTIAKIEDREGINNIDGIISACSGIMIARGDMGISIPIHEVPLVQKRIIKKCKKAKRFVITATQMLESMTENHNPSRAEVSDVANAVLDGTDYVMLSAETAVGKYPAQTVKMMDKIINYTENN